MTAVSLTTSRLASPIGDIQLVCEDQTLSALEFSDHGARMWKLLERRYGQFEVVEVQSHASLCGPLHDYFDGALDAVADLPADGGGTPFQHRVWSALREIPAGSTLSYRDLAARLGMPKAVRAVASANALNPISIVVPCHRLVGGDGSLRGYSGGLERKRWLLEHEGARLS